MAPKSALDWLFTTQFFGVKLGLDNMRRLIEENDLLPPPTTRIVQIAGTNGKGSVCALAESVARASGLRTGLFTSPHLVRFHERIRVDGREISDEDLDLHLRVIRQRVASWEYHPTFFEIALAAALRHFKASHCELLFLETGMGGRLDATTAVPADVAVLTRIGMDHMQWLGDTLEKIAAEKAAIIRPGKPVLSAPQPPEAAEVIAETAREKNAQLRIVDLPLSGYPISLAGSHQALNAALAAECLHAAGYKLRVESLRFGLANTHWPGRFDIRRDGSLVIDGSHNPEACDILAATWQESFPNQKATIIFGTADDKNARGMMERLTPIAARWIFTPFRSPRATDTATLAAAANNLGIAETDITTAVSPAEALTAPRAPPEPTLATGSLFLAGEMIAHIEKRPYRPGSQ